ncbi:MAG TPA: hypothetical protein VNA25_15980 [Phycisphaerae bacterium]|nr:hypothetical protein [Phycisphaerae bacterium]
MVKTLIWELRERGRNLLVLDLKNDFAGDAPFVSRASLRCQYISFDGLPYNPLIPTPTRHPRTGEPVIMIAQHVAGVAAVLKTAYRLGDQQEAAVKQAIRDCLSARGLATSGTMPFDESLEFPDFNDVGVMLDASNPSARRRLDPLFDLEIFRDEFRQTPFERLLHTSLVIHLSDIPSEHVKNALAQIVVLSAHNFYNAQTHTTDIRQYFVFDEAHRVLNSSFLAAFVRECRAYGVGIILSSQYPSDFPREVSGCMATKIIHGNDRNEEQVRQIVALLGCQGDEEQVGGLDMFQALVSNTHHLNTFIHTLAYPQLMVYRFLQEHGAGTAQQLEAIEGLDRSRLPYLLTYLTNGGLIEEVSGQFRLIRPV